MSPSRPLDITRGVCWNTPSPRRCATRHLADLGRVIKVERPGRADFARDYDSRVKGLASHFVWTQTVPKA